MLSTEANRRAFFLDRDGVLNGITVDAAGVPHPPASADVCEILPGVSEACEILRAAGYLLICVTNQPDVARGAASVSQIERINDFLKQSLRLDALYVCWHDNADRCDCRKPLPGLLNQAASEYKIRLSASFMIGDRWSDVAAGTAAGCGTFLIPASYSKAEKCSPDWVVPSLLEAAKIVANR